jgi:hypothetical protein
MGIGRELEKKLYISDVYSRVSKKGGCTYVIKNLLNYWWDKQKLQFKNDSTVNLGIKENNIAAIKCYSKFGFIIIPNKFSIIKDVNGKEITRQYMILTKEAYVEKYLLPKYNEILGGKINLVRSA